MLVTCEKSCTFAPENERVNLVNQSKELRLRQLST